MKLTQGIIHLSVLGLLIQVQQGRSEELSWQVRPSVCVQEETSDVCRLSVMISAGKALTSNGNTKYCVHLDDAILGCAFAQEFPIKTALEIRQPTELLIKSKQRTVYSQVISLKSTRAKKQRFRVRSPWSLF